jgi:protein SCO1/2
MGGTLDKEFVMKQEGFGGEKIPKRDRLFGITSYIAFAVIAITMAMLFGVIAGGYALTQSELRQIEFKQYPGRQLPLNMGFINEGGAPVLLRHYFEGSSLPVIIVPGYYRCQTLCSGLSEGLVLALQGIVKTMGRDFRVVYVSIDPAEQQASAIARKRAWVQRYARPGSENGCAYLRGASGAIEEFTRQIGFHYRYHFGTKEYAHPAGFLVASPDGRISSYFFGVSFSSAQLEAALDAAGRGEIAPPARSPLALCFRDEASVQKDDSVIRVVRYLTLGSIVGIALLMIRASRAKRNRWNGQDE